MNDSESSGGLPSALSKTQDGEIVDAGGEVDAVISNDRSRRLMAVLKLRNVTREERWKWEKTRGIR